MTRLRPKLLENRNFNDSDALISQLKREISCLERQFERLKLLDGKLDTGTANTYRDMIFSRKEMLQNLI
ncbi:hypothetical protein [Agarilytica rhodophyticola]|uniref:hypothetical protein n=1 Tax=Agarilytica rhodophyticola TaxID=1737490 RepID=UPI000B343273|nr:hypothetical protein [Agarilytica rhodophyticola]